MKREQVTTDNSRPNSGRCGTSRRSTPTPEPHNLLTIPHNLRNPRCGTSRRCRRSTAWPLSTRIPTLWCTLPPTVKFTNDFQACMLGRWYESVNFGAAQIRADQIGEPR